MIVTVKRSLSAQDLAGYDVPAEFAAARHGGRTDVTTERPGLVASYQAPVAPSTREAAPFGTPSSTLPLASGSSHRFFWVLCKMMVTWSPTRTQ